MLDKKTEIFNKGKELFWAKGFKDTNIADITKSAGMAVGTFYNYYPSKEKLFLEIFIQENLQLKKSVIESINLNADPLDVVKEVMSLNIIGLNANPILREWYNRDVFNKLEQHFREENGMKHFDFLYTSFAELMAEWQAEGKIRNDIDVDLIMAFFKALLNIDFHKEEIGIEYFPHIFDYLIEFVMNGLNSKEMGK